MNNWILNRLYNIRDSLGCAFSHKPKHAPVCINKKAVGSIYVFIRAWNRPLYLWTCLDSLLRSTAYPCHFILIDNASTDPLIREIVASFERRQFFHAVHFMDQNSPDNQKLVYAKYRPQLGKYFCLIDGDISIEKSSPCWLETMIRIAEKRNNLALLGSAIDKQDFVDPKWAAKAMPDIEPQQLGDLIKQNSPERRAYSTSAEVIKPYNPPGRLLLLRTAAVDQFGLQMGNKALCHAAHQAGFESAIASSVIHRHLSLLNLFDYPNYDFVQLKRYLGKVAVK